MSDDIYTQLINEKETILRKLSDADRTRLLILSAWEDDRASARADDRASRKFTRLVYAGLMAVGVAGALLPKGVEWMPLCVFVGIVIGVVSSRTYFR